MKKIWILLFMIGLLILLNSSTNYQKSDYYFDEYIVYYQPHGTCEMLIKYPIYEDDDYRYFLSAGGCTGENYYFIRYKGQYIDISSALSENLFTIQDIIDSNIPALIIEEK